MPMKLHWVAALPDEQYSAKTNKHLFGPARLISLEITGNSFTIGFQLQQLIFLFAHCKTP
jgi:hypothetical protein